MLFAHLKRILKLVRLRLRGPRGAQDEFTLAAIAQNLRRLAKLVARPPSAIAGVVAEPTPVSVPRDAASPLLKERMVRAVPKNRGNGLAGTIADFCNNIGTRRTRAEM